MNFFLLISWHNSFQSKEEAKKLLENHISFLLRNNKEELKRLIHQDDVGYLSCDLLLLFISKLDKSLFKKERKIIFNEFKIKSTSRNDFKYIKNTLRGLK